MSCAKYVFTDIPKPDHMSRLPAIDAEPFFGHHRPPQAVVAETKLVATRLGE
nr:hypothetical protein [Glycomyces terrestris]